MHWTPTQWATIVRHARAERICARAAAQFEHVPSLAAYWQEEREMHAAVVRAHADAAAPTRGFAALTPWQRAEMAGKGGRAAQASGYANTFTSKTARAAGLKSAAKRRAA